MAEGPTAEGPWTVVEDPFTIREDGWDNWHLSTGPILQLEGLREGWSKPPEAATHG